VHDLRASLRLPLGLFVDCGRSITAQSPGKDHRTSRHCKAVASRTQASSTAAVPVGLPSVATKNPDGVVESQPAGRGIATDLRSTSFTPSDTGTRGPSPSSISSRMIRDASATFAGMSWAMVVRPGEM
jgi:hypothetical protein